MRIVATPSPAKAIPHFQLASATVRNTIVGGSSAQNGLKRISGTLNHSYNLVDGFTTLFNGTAADLTELAESPRFLDATNGDFRQDIGSPAINTGIDLTSGVPIDFDGNSRPSSGAFEIGAYEFSSSGGSLRVLKWVEIE
jgi:hypothetical protein